MNMNYSLTELKEVKQLWLQRAIDESIPQNAIKIAKLGERYQSVHHGAYHIYPVLISTRYAVFTHRHKEGRLIRHGVWEQLDTISVHLVNKFDPYKLDKFEQLPLFWDGLKVLSWTLSDRRDEFSSNDLFIPGNWWEQAKEYLPQAANKVAASAKIAKEHERMQLYAQLLIDQEV